MKITLCCNGVSGLATGVGGSLNKLATGLRAAGVAVEEYYPPSVVGVAVSDFYYGVRGIKRPWQVHSYTEMSWNTPGAFRTYCSVMKSLYLTYLEEKQYALRDEFFFKPYFSMHRAMEAKCIQNNHCVCESEVIKRELHNDHGVENKNIDLIPIGIDSVKYSPRKVDRRKYGIPEGDFLVSWVGHSEYNKGMKYLLESAKALEGEDVTFILRSPPLPETHVLYPQWVKLKEKVRFMPRFDDVSDFYNLSDAFYMSSTYEAFCIALAEALSCAKPALCFEGVGIADEVVFDNQTGFRVPYRDAAQVAEKVLYLKEHPEKAMKMGIEGRDLVKKRYPPAQMIEKHVRMYKQFA